MKATDPMAVVMALVLSVSQTVAQPGGRPGYPDQSQRPPIYDEEVLQRLEQTGLVVLPQGEDTNLHSCYYGLQMSGQPIYVTADAMLYLWYEAHREALMAAERQWLRPQLTAFAVGMLKATRQLQTGGDDPLLRANVMMLEVVWALLDPSHEPAADVAAAAGAELTRVREHSLVQEYPGEDYTPYEVRGYYTRNAQLSNYFRGAKYLARRYFRIADARYPAAADRELRQALLLVLAMRSDSGLTDLYRQSVDLRVFLCGPIDTIGLDQLLSAADAVWGAGWGRDKLADLDAVRRELLSDKYPTTRINTRVTDPDVAMMPAKNIGLLGEHYLPDSDLFHQTTEPRVPLRHLPSGLDVGTALGSPLAADQLREQAAGFPQVVPNAEAFSKQMKLEGIYGSWMETLRTLFDQPTGLPDFAKTTTYEAKQLNCCLTSWAHLRHNYIPYGAQAVTCLGVGSASPGLVEPLPDFFAAYGKMCRELREKLIACQIEGRPIAVLDLLAEKAATFERCASDQLAGHDTSWATRDIYGFPDFIARVYFDSPLLVADVATSSTTHEVLHAASGPFHRVLVRYLVEGRPTIAEGYVGSYYEWAEPSFGRVTDEEWQQRLRREYDRPEPPEWLAGLYQPEPGERTGQRQRLREIERLLAADKYDEAAQASEAFIKQEQDTEWAPRAVLMLGTYLITHKRPQEALAMYERARPMYGCDARDAALQRVRNYRPGPVTWEDRRAEAERKFAEQLAPTDPRPGLTEAQEIERQDRRAALLLGMEGQRYPPIGDPDAEYVQRLLTDCPQSGYVPFAELALVLSRLGNRYVEPSPEPDPDTLAQARTDLQALAQKYRDSVIGQAARIAAAGVLIMAGDFSAAYRETVPLLDLQRPRPDPYLLSAAALGQANWDIIGPGGLSLKVTHMAQRLLELILPGACRAGDLASVQQYVALVEKYHMAENDGNWERFLARCAYLRDEPTALRAMLPLWADVGFVPMYGSPEEEPDIAEFIVRGLRLADQFPRSKAAPAALFLVWRVTHYGYTNEHEAQAHAAARRLAATYPDSLEGLIVQANEAARRDDAAAYKQHVTEIRTRVPARETPAPADTYAQDVIEELSPAPQPPPDAAVLTRWKQRYGPFIEAAKLSDGALRACKFEQALVGELIKRLPEDELRIALTCSQASESYQWLDLINEAITHHPTDPVAYELRFRRGSMDDMAAIIAAGPKTPHFPEAVDGFTAWQPSDRQSSAESEAYPYRQLARHHAGTAVEPLAGAVVAGIYLHCERPEQALQFLAAQLAAIPEGRLFRERLVAAQEDARQQIAIKRAAANPPLWAAALQTADSRYGDERRPGVLLSPKGDLVFVRGLLGDGQAGLVAFETDAGQRLWQAPCPDVQGLLCVGGGLIFSTGHGTVGRLDVQDGHTVWETPLGLAQTSSVWLAHEGEALRPTGSRGCWRAWTRPQARCSGSGTRTSVWATGRPAPRATAPWPSAEASSPAGIHTIRCALGARRTASLCGPSRRRK